MSNWLRWNDRRRAETIADRFVFFLQQPAREGRFSLVSVCRANRHSRRSFLFALNFALVTGIGSVKTVEAKRASNTSALAFYASHFTNTHAASVKADPLVQVNSTQQAESERSRLAPCRKQQPQRIQVTRILHQFLQGCLSREHTTGILPD